MLNLKMIKIARTTKTIGDCVDYDFVTLFWLTTAVVTSHFAAITLVELNLRSGMRPGYPRSRDESKRSGVGKNFKSNTIGNHGDRLFFRYVRIPPI